VLYHSPQFTSTLLSDLSVCLAAGSKYMYSQNMMKFFAPNEELLQADLASGKVDLDNTQYNFDYGNCLLTCMHRFCSSQNLNVPGVIRSGLCFTQPLVIPDLPTSHAKATIYNSKEMALRDDPVFKSKCKSKHLELIYNHQQKQYVKLMSILESLPEQYYKACISLPFHEYTGASTPVNALNKEAEALLWHQRLIHCGAHSMKDIHNHVDGVPNLSSFKLDDLSKCPTCIKTNLTKIAAGKKSLRATVT
jgi:hypothetical protein